MPIDISTLFEGNGNLFSPLSGKYSSLYLNMLFIIADAFSADIITLSRTDIIQTLRDQLSGEFAKADTLEDESEEEWKSENINDRISYCLRKLKETGWIDDEDDERAFQQNIIIPSYARMLINTLKEIAKGQKVEYDSYIFNTYATLEAAKRQASFKYRLMALNSAYDNFNHFLDMLRSLFQNIKRIYKSYLGEDLNAVIENYFQYEEDIFDKYIFPINVIDSLAKFRKDITETLTSWLENDCLPLASEGVDEGRYKTKEEGLGDVTRKINFMLDTYESFGQINLAINNKYYAYRNAMGEKIKALSRSDRRLKSLLIRLLNASSDKEISHLMQDAVNPHAMRTLGDNSLYNTREEAVRESVRLSAKSAEIPLTDGLSLLSRQSEYSSRNLDAYIARCFEAHGKERLRSEELLIASFKDYVMAILSYFRGRNDEAPFSSELSSTDKEIIVSGYSLPEMTFTKGKKNENKN